MGQGRGGFPAGKIPERRRASGAAGRSGPLTAKPPKLPQVAPNGTGPGQGTGASPGWGDTKLPRAQKGQERRGHGTSGFPRKKESEGRPPRPRAAEPPQRSLPAASPAGASRYLAVVGGAGVEVHGGQEIGLVDAGGPVGAGHVGDLLPRGWGHKTGLKARREPPARAGRAPGNSQKRPK